MTDIFTTKNKAMKKEELQEVLRLHKLWLNDDINGVKADLSGADLYGADLSGANLSGAYLSGGNISGANPNNAKVSTASHLNKELFDTYLIN